MCPKKGKSQIWTMGWEKKLFPTKKESQHLSFGKKKYLFIKIAFSFPAKSNEDHTQNLPPALNYQLFNHNQNILKM